METVLVTGAAGFIGSHLCESLLRKNYKVIGIDNFDPFYSQSIKEDNLQSALQYPNFSFIEGDAGSVDNLNQIPVPVDVVVHLAAKAGVLPSLKEPSLYIRANIEVTNNILEWMRCNNVKKMVFASSSSVYGNNTKTPFEETDSVNDPISPYAFTKRSCELMNYIYHTLYGVDIVNLRFFTVYGERQRPDLAIRKFVHLISNELPITVYGDGTTARDYTYFLDTVSGIISAIDYVSSRTGIYEVFNLGNNQPVSLMELIQIIAKVCQKEPHLIFEEKKLGDVDITYASIEKAKLHLNYHPETSLEEGISRFVSWYNGKQEMA